MTSILLPVRLSFETNSISHSDMENLFQLINPINPVLHMEDILIESNFSYSYNGIL